MKLLRIRNDISDISKLSSVLGCNQFCCFGVGSMYLLSNTISQCCIFWFVYINPQPCSETGCCTRKGYNIPCRFSYIQIRYMQQPILVLTKQFIMPVLYAKLIQKLMSFLKKCSKTQLSTTNSMIQLGTIFFWYSGIFDIFLVSFGGF